MALVPYVPPGITIQELTTPSVAPAIIVPGNVCLVGVAQGFISVTDQVTLQGTIPAKLPSVPAGASMATSAIISVIDALQPQLAPLGFQPTSDYTFSNSNYTITRAVTSNTLQSSAASAQANLTLAAGPVPTVGQTVSFGQNGTLNGSAASGQAVFTLAAGPVPAVGQTVTIAGTLANGADATEIVTVASVSGQAVTAVSNLVFTHATTSAVTWNPELGTVSNVVGQVVTLSTNLAFTHPSSSAVSWGNIPDGHVVYVSYTYTPSDYFQAIRLTNMNDVQQRFGNAFDPSGTVINSTLSYAAGVAFTNGVSSLVLAPLFYSAGAAAPAQPTAAQAAQQATWAGTLTALRTFEDIDIIVPVIGQSAAQVTDAVQLSVFQAVQDHIEFLKNEGLYAIGVFGEDSTTSTTGSPLAQDPILVAHCQTLIPRYARDVTQQLILTNIANLLAANANGTFNVGGQYLATAIAGSLASQPTSTPLTRQTISGFVGVASSETRTLSQKNNDAANGMFVVEEKNNVVQVRHAITLDNTSSATREVSVVRAKHQVVDSVAFTLNTQIIGKVAADADAPTLVNNVVIATLQMLLSDNVINGYGNVQTQITTLDPTTLAVTFSYSPLFPINYITIGFSLDLSAQSVTVTAGEATS